MQGHGLRVRQARDKIFLVVAVEQETDRAAVHAVDRHIAAHGPVQRFEHEAVTPQSDDDLCLLRFHVGVLRLEGGLGVARGVAA